MGVVAIKLVSGQRIQFEFECGAFDLMMDTDPANGWEEVSRDCDAWVNRWERYPYASGSHRGGVNGSQMAMPEPGFPFRKYFPADGDNFTATLDFSDINEGILPITPCSQMWLLQNGKKLPCEAFTINYTTSVLTILEIWRVPGAAYEAIYTAPVYVPPGS